MQMNHLLYQRKKNGYNRRQDMIDGGSILHKIKKLLVFLCVVLLTGCTAASGEEAGLQGADSFTSMEEEADLSYEVPISSPGILVNQLGYLTESTKVAIFTGKEIPETFHLVEMESGRVVYTGQLEDKGYNKEQEEYNSYGSFTEYQTPGAYYIEAPILGRSYPFYIENAIYDDVFREACKQYYYNRCGMTLTKEYAGEAAHNACHMGKAVLREDSSVSIDVSGGWHQDEFGQKDVVSAARNVAIMLLAYELYGESFTDEMGIPESGNGIPDLLDEVKYEIDWLLKMQDQATGAVYAGITVYEQKNNNAGKADCYVEPATILAEKAFAMVLAKFSYLYQSYDNECATNYLKAADRAWNYVQLNDTGKTDEWTFAAAAELYRAAGQAVYHRYVLEYLGSGDYQSSLEEISFLGCVAYISTKQTVNIQYCEDIVKMLMARAEEVSAASRQSVFLTAGNKKQDNNAELLENMMYLTTVDHIITNHEYETMIENHLHYFMGRNALAISYIDNVGENNYKSIDNSLGIMNQFVADSKLIFMLSEIVGNHRI